LGTKRSPGSSLFSTRFAALRAGLRRKEGPFSFAYPALIPHPGSPGLGNVTGLFPAVPPRRDWSNHGFEVCFVLGLRIKGCRNFDLLQGFVLDFGANKW
jgi:hypothetical protein